jgi:ribosomal protein L37AE/L43A
MAKTELKCETCGKKTVEETSDGLYCTTCQKAQKKRRGPSTTRAFPTW